jgi:hypothetical protein
MAKFVKKGKEAKQEDMVSAESASSVEDETVSEEVGAPPAGEVSNLGDSPTELPPEVADDTEAGRLLASQANVHSYDPRAALQFPGNEDEGQDMPSSKDHLLNDHKIRIGNKRRFLTDALCRAVGCENYVLEVDKLWVPNPLGKGGNIAVRYTRELIGVYILFDKFELVPKPEIVALKRKLANQHGFKYIYETPEIVLSHDELGKQLEAQKDIEHPEVTELKAIQAQRAAK